MQGGRHYRASVLSVVLVSGTCLAQNFFPPKDLAFAQVAAGETIETLITLSNAGSQVYGGTLSFRTGQAEIWNPVVNGTPISGGQMPVSIQPGATLTFRVTADALVSGAAALVADNFAQDNFVEGNLTYFVRGETGVADSVGVAPSLEFFRAALPFDDFSTIALALANGDLFGSSSAGVTLRVSSASGEQLAETMLELPARAHQAKFLSELFPDLSLSGPGRVDLSSPVPVLGTAVTLVDNQISTLPLLPSPTLYRVSTFSAIGTTSSGEASLWAEGPFVKGYLRITTVNGIPVAAPSTSMVSGRFLSGVLRLNFYAAGAEFFNEEVSIYVAYPDFRFDADFQSGSWVMTFLSDNTSLPGVFDLTRVN